MLFLIKIMINILMKILSIIIFLLFPSIVLGGIDDVYDCTSTNIIKIEDFKIKQFKNQKFKFQRFEKKLIFGSGQSYFKNLTLDKEIFSNRNEEIFTFTDSETVNVFNYDNGLFFTSGNTYKSLIGLSGKCSIF